MKNHRIIKRTMSFFIVCALLSAAVFSAMAVESGNAMEKLDKTLIEKLETVGDDEKIPVSVWLTDIDHAEEYSRVESALKDKIAAGELPQEILLLLRSEAGSYGVTADPVDSAAIDRAVTTAQMQKYIALKRAVSAAMHQETNQSRVDTLGLTEVAFVSEYAPNFVAAVTKAELEQLVTSDFVTSVYLINAEELPNELFEEETYPNEIYRHKTNGKTDWVLVYYEMLDSYATSKSMVLFGRAFYASNAGIPFTYGYAVYDVAQKEYVDLAKIKDESRFAGLSDALEQCGAGVKITEPSIGENVQYLDAFLQAYRNESGWPYAADPEKALQQYAELYYHQTDGVTDWVIVQGDAWFAEQNDRHYEVIGDRVITSDAKHLPFDNTYAVYDVAQNKFYPLDGDILNTYGQSFPGLWEALSALQIGSLIGDINSDGKLNINDATEMQRCLAELTPYPANDGVAASGYTTLYRETIAYVSDMNRNRRHDIGDVTLLQELLAEKHDVYTGTITVNIPQDSWLYECKKLKIEIFQNDTGLGGKMFTLQTRDSGEKYLEYAPKQQSRINLYPGVFYTAKVYDAAHMAQFPLMVYGSDDLVFTIE